MDPVSIWKAMQAAGFSPTQAAVLALLVLVLLQQRKAIRRVRTVLDRLKVRSQRLAEDRARLHTYEVETRVRLERLERRGNGNVD